MRSKTCNIPAFRLIDNDDRNGACMADFSLSSQFCGFRAYFPFQVYQSGSGHPSWKPIFVAVSDRDLLLYDSAPSSKEAWATPMQTHPLIATRLVHSGPGPGQPGKAQQVLTFGTRTGACISFLVFSMIYATFSLIDTDYRVDFDLGLRHGSVLTWI